MNQDSFNEISKSICLIDKGNKDTGTGFFLRAKYHGKHIYMLITAQHFIPFELVEIRKKIEITTDNGNIKQEIILNNNDRKILCFQDKDITAIEIIEKDIIRNKVKFLKYNKKIVNFLNIEAYIFHHPNGEKLQCNNGKILSVHTPKEYEFEHNLYTQKGSSGSPIIFFKQSKKRPYPKPRVMGVHTSCVPKTKKNIGTFINVLIEELKAGIDNLIYKQDLVMPNNSELKVPSGTHLIVGQIKVPEKSEIHIGSKLTIGKK